MEAFDRPEGKLLVGVYRESIFTTVPAQIARSLNQFSARGDFMLLVKDKDHYRVAVSDTPGFLLAESLSAHFDVENLVYVENLDGQRVILVIITGGTVTADTIVLADELADEVSQYVVDEQFHFRLSGGVRLDRQAEQVLTWQELEPHFSSTVALAPVAELHTLKKARELAMGRSSSVGALAVAVAVATVGFAWMVVVPSEPPAQVVVDPLALAYQGWSSELPVEEGIRSIARYSLSARSSPGWIVQSVKLEQGAAAVTMTPASSLASIQKATDYFKHAATPIPGTGEYGVRLPMAAVPRARQEFDAILGNQKLTVAQTVDLLNRGPWGFMAAVKQVDDGIGYKRFTVSVEARTNEHVLLRAMIAIGPQLRHGTVQMLEFKPIEGRLTADLQFYVRS